MYGCLKLRELSEGTVKYGEDEKMTKPKWHQIVLGYLVVLGVLVGCCVSGWFFMVSVAASIFYIITHSDKGPGPPGIWPKNGDKWVQ